MLARAATADTQLPNTHSSVISVSRHTFRSVPTAHADARHMLPYQDDAASARALLVEMMADLDEEVAELFLMEEEVQNLAEIVNV